MKRLAIVVSVILLVGCGVVGAPVPPELVGVAPTIEKQKRQHALEAEREAVQAGEPVSAHDPHDLDLPPSRPVGTR